jgi:hypothetical protein
MPSKWRRHDFRRATASGFHGGGGHGRMRLGEPEQLARRAQPRRKPSEAPRSKITLYQTLVIKRLARDTRTPFQCAPSVVANISYKFKFV